MWTANATNWSHAVMINAQVFEERCTGSTVQRIQRQIVSLYGPIGSRYGQSVWNIARVGRATAGVKSALGPKLHSLFDIGTSVVWGRPEIGMKVKRFL
jgi:hypothetical protein